VAVGNVLVVSVGARRFNPGSRCASELVERSDANAAGVRWQTKLS
jgi:hypothetical protein